MLRRVLLLAVCGRASSFGAQHTSLHTPHHLASQRLFVTASTDAYDAHDASVYSDATALIQQLSSQLRVMSQELSHAVARCDKLESECRAQRERLARLAAFEAALDAAQAPGQMLAAAGRMTDAALLWAMVASSALRKQLLAATGGPDLSPRERLMMTTAVYRSWLALAAHAATERWREGLAQAEARWPGLVQRANMTAHELADAAVRVWSWLAVSSVTLWEEWSSAALAALAALDGSSLETLRRTLATATAVQRARLRVAYVRWRQAAAALVDDELRPRVAHGVATLRPALEAAAARTAAVAGRCGRRCRVLAWRARRGAGAVLLKLPSLSLSLPRAQGGANSAVALPRSLTPRSVSRASVTAAAKRQSSGAAVSALMQLDIDPELLCGEGFEWGCDAY